MKLCHEIRVLYLTTYMAAMEGRKNQGSSGALIGVGFMAFPWVLNLFTLYMSRLREYYADRHSASVVDNGAQKFSTGLAKIVNETKRTSKAKQRGHRQNTKAFKALFITDPDRATTDSTAIAAIEVSNRQNLVEEILSKKLIFADKLMEALSTHPNIIKRLRALQELT